jgi:deoxyribodipyrimidine photo-lyase
MYPQTREAALERWSAFLPAAVEYATHRQLVVPGHPHVSRLSPALRLRLVTEEEILASLLAAHPLASVEQLVREILWRTYWKSCLEQRPSIWRWYRARVAALRPAAGPRVASITAAESGVAIMDYFTRELIDTGWLHNHARLWFAAWWIHVERLPWELGADFFLRHLLDGDPASNTLSWRWVAGLHTPGKSYLVRRSNLEKYIDPALLAEHAAGLDALDDDRAQAAPLPDEPLFPWEPVPPAAVDPGHLPDPWGLWIHGDDLAVETHPRLTGLKPRAAAAILSRPLCESFALSERRWRHLRSGLLEGVTRIAAHFRCAADFELGPPLAAGLAAWARAHRLQTVVTMRPFAGPLADELPAVEAALRAEGVSLICLQRPYDATLLPLARGGFFPFYEKAREALRLDAGPG